MTRLASFPEPVVERGQTSRSNSSPCVHTPAFPARSSSVAIGRSARTGHDQFADRLAVTRRKQSRQSLRRSSVRRQVARRDIAQTGPQVRQKFVPGLSESERTVTGRLPRRLA